jgi:phage replication O-like protein O
MPFVVKTPQLENGYTRIANEIMEALIKYRIPGEQMQCLLLIIRKTYGFNKLWDAISNSQFVEFTGLNKSNICRAVRALINKNIVVKKDNKYVSSYCFNKRYDTWKGLSKKTTVVKSDILVLSKKTNTKDIITKDNIPSFKFNKKVPLPANIFLTEKMKAYVKKQGCENSGHAESLFEDFCINQTKRNMKWNNWTMAFYSWVRNDKKIYNSDKYKKYEDFK